MNVLGLISNNKERLDIFFSVYFPQKNNYQCIRFNNFCLFFDLHNNYSYKVIRYESLVFIGKAFIGDKEVTSDTLRNFHLGINIDCLIETIWGEYAILRVMQEGVKIFLSNSKVPLFYCNVEEDILISTFIQWFQHMGVKLNINEAVACNFVLYGPHNYYNDTFFKGIFEIPFGSEIDFKPGCNDDIVLKYKCTYPKNHTSENFSDIIDNVLYCWIKEYNNIYLQFSGGIDSSAILLSLASIISEKQKLTAINLYNSRVAFSNELSYAKKIATEAEVNLLAIDVNDFPLNAKSAFNNQGKRNKPTPGIENYDLREYLKTLCNTGTKSLMIDGQGGDHIFMRPPSYSSIVDCFFLGGIKKALKKVYELACLNREPYLQVFRKALLHYVFEVYDHLKQYKSRGIHQRPSWINKEMLRKSYIKNKYRPLRTWEILCAPGNCERISNINQVIMHLSSYENTLAYDVFHPLLMQPIIKTGLSIPTYDLYDGEYDRLPFRNLLYKKFLNNIFWRKCKGETAGLVQLEFINNAAHIKELCANGFLARNKLINTDAVLSQVDNICIGDIFNAWPILNLIGMEIFLLGWNL